MLLFWLLLFADVVGEVVDCAADEVSWVSGLGRKREFD